MPRDRSPSRAGARDRSRSPPRTPTLVHLQLPCQIPHAFEHRGRVAAGLDTPAPRYPDAIDRDHGYHGGGYDRPGTPNNPIEVGDSDDSDTDDPVALGLPDIRNIPNFDFEALGIDEDNIEDLVADLARDLGIN